SAVPGPEPARGVSGVVVVMSAKLATGGDLQFGEDLAQMPFDGTGAQIKPGRDFRIGQSFPDQPGDLGLLGREFDRGADRAFARGFTGRPQFLRGTTGEALDSHRREAVVRGAQLRSCVYPPVLPAQPFAVQQPGSTQFDP